MTAQIHQFIPRKRAAANVYPWYRPDPYLIADVGDSVGVDRVRVGHGGAGRRGGVAHRLMPEDDDGFLPLSDGEEEAIDDPDEWRDYGDE